MTTLRPYQQIAVDAVRASYTSGRRAPLLVAPTGAGKTITFAWIAANTSRRGKRVLIVAHRRELIKQAAAKLKDAGVRYGIIAPWADPNDEAVQVGSIQTIGRRLKKAVGSGKDLVGSLDGDIVSLSQSSIGTFDLIVIDEAHHSVSGMYLQLIQAMPDARILGVTATPERLDGRGLGVHAGGCFDDLVLGPTISDLTAAGFLVKAKVYAPAEKLDLSGVPMKGGDYETRALTARVNQPQLTGDAVDHYRRFAPGQPAIAFCSNVAHAESVAAAFREAGWRSVCAHGGSIQSERDAAIGGLATGDVQVLTCADLISEGLDVPAVSVVILLRPTKSLGLHVQQIGRGLRPAPDKPHLIILDHAGNTFTHGLPDSPHEWTLDGRKKRDKSDIPATWQCPSCYAIQPPTRTCKECGWVTPAEAETRRPEAEIVEGHLAEVDPESAAWLRRAPLRDVLAKAKSRSDFQEIARARGYKPGWVFYQMQNRQGAQA